jgi:hypothetical protein
MLKLPPESKELADKRYYTKQHFSHSKEDLTFAHLLQNKILEMYP